MKRSTAIGPTLLLNLLLLAGGWHTTSAQARLTLQSGSRLWIEGASTLNAFTCHSEDVGGYGVLERGATQTFHAAATSEAPAARAEVTVYTETFDCGKKRMNHDFYEALKADAFPVIRFALDEAAVLAQPDAEDQMYRLHALGQLSIAGATRRIEMNVLGWRLADGRYRLTGSQHLLMSDFGIDPPTALLGLIRAHDRILVRFDLVAASTISTTTTTQSTQ